jgi:hypothetical protein
LYQNLFAFSQDIFGNKFSFDTIDGSVVFFDIEDARRKVLAKDFVHWMNIMIEETDFYTGSPYEERWKEDYDLEPDQRLRPKVPFIVGGSFDTTIFYTVNFPKYLSFNADLARQVAGLKDGTRVTFKIMSGDS